MYEKAFFSVQINGYVSEPLPIQCSLRDLSNERANIPFGFKFAYKPVERHLTSIKNWTSHSENRDGGGIRRRCQDFYDGTSRH